VNECPIASEVDEFIDPVLSKILWLLPYLSSD